MLIGVGRLWSASFLLFFLFLGSASAERPVSGEGRLAQNSASLSSQGVGVLALKLYSENASTRLQKQAVLKLTNVTNNSVTWQTTDDSAQCEFANIPIGRYEIEVSAAGYLTTKTEAEVTDASHPATLDIVLKRDASAINSDSAEAVVPAKVRKLTKRAIGMMKSEHFAQAHKELDEAYKLAPANPDLKFLLGYLYFKEKDLDKAGESLAAASHLNPQNADVFTLLGRVGLEREDYAGAQSALEQAVLLDYENWLPHDLLAATYLRQKDYKKALDEAEIAIKAGQRTASLSRLILGQSLLEMGRTREATEAFNLFLQESPQDPIAGRVRNMVLSQDHGSTTPIASSADSVLLSPGLDPLAVLPAPALWLKSWQPRGIDEVKPFVVPAVTCPFAQVTDEAGKRATQLVQDVERFAAVEQLLHQAVDDYGIPTRTITRKYNYVASMSEPRAGDLYVNEFRADKVLLEGYPDNIATSGFAVLALVFHPRMRENFAMACEGLGDWHGHATWLVHFRQRDDRPNRMHSYKSGNRQLPVGLKGRAWITADNFQIVRMEAEIVNPIPEIRLLSERQAVEYGPVPFPKKNTTVWLPKYAQIYLDFRKHHYYRRHSFDHYMLFSVDTNDKTEEPALPQADAGHLSPAHD
jgi:tetratricopeptide (TPR) repeat protein